MKFCTDLCCINLTVSVLRKCLKHVSLCWGHYLIFLGLFWVHYSMSWKPSLDILRECLDFTVMVTKLRNALIFLNFRHFCVFLVHFEVCFSNIREPSNIFNGISFWTPVPWIKVCLSINLSVHRSVQHFSQESATTFFLIFCTMVDDWNN